MRSKLLYTAAFLIAVAAFAQEPAPQRTILENRVTQGRAKDNTSDRTAAPERAIDSVLNSTEDLNSIRDAYVRRLAGDGCRPEVAIRVAELRANLEETDTHRGRSQTTAAAAQQTSAELTDSLLILASGWYQPRPESEPPRVNPDRDRAQLLDQVLSARDSQSAAPSTGADPAQAKAELDRLLATCRGAGR